MPATLAIIWHRPNILDLTSLPGGAFHRWYSLQGGFLGSKESIWFFHEGSEVGRSYLPERDVTAFLGRVNAHPPKPTLSTPPHPGLSKVWHGLSAGSWVEGA